MSRPIFTGKPSFFLPDVNAPVSIFKFLCAIFVWVGAQQHAARRKKIKMITINCGCAPSLRKNQKLSWAEVDFFSLPDVNAMIRINWGCVKV